MEKSPHSTVSGTSNGKAPAAYVTLILDETGSMQDCKGAAIAGINAYLFTLTLFNSDKLEVPHHAVPAIRVPDLTEESYQPAASTPLYDAIGRTLATAAHEAASEARKLCVILTDGLENASREYTREGITGMIMEIKAGAGSSSTSAPTMTRGRPEETSGFQGTTGSNSASERPATHSTGWARRRPPT
ncbi:MAG: hypothetical protein M3M98_06600 [Nitrospirota bacterium]|nr:hypothetical protein [Nitrospirota bacterium]